MAIRDPFDLSDLPEGYEYGELAAQVNDASRRLAEMEPLYERVKELVELAASAPNLRLAVVDAEDTTDINVWNESMTVLSPQMFYRVVKMEGE